MFPAFPSILRFREQSNYGVKFQYPRMQPNPDSLSEGRDSKENKKTLSFPTVF